VKNKISICILAALALVLIAYIPSSEGESDPYIEEVIYSKSSEETTTIVTSGRDNATFYRYLILDDYSQAPVDWYEPNFNDSSWSFGAAPFGDRQIDGIQPNLIWNTQGNSPYENDVILVRHKFQMTGIVTSAQIDVAFANYCTPYLNGDIIYDERGASSHAQEYWNDDGTEDITPSSFIQGQNVLAVYARDTGQGTWGNNNRQWLDLQITASVFEPTNESIIFGDTVTVAFKAGNEGNLSAGEVQIQSFTNNTEVYTQQLETVSQNFQSLFFFTWTPEFIGNNSLSINLTCNCTDQNLTNNNLVLNITSKIYILKASMDSELEYVNQTRILTKNITITNTGGLPDNVTLVPASGQINSEMSFSPNNFLLLPGESKDVTVNAVLPSPIDDGFHNLSFEVKTQYEFTTSHYLLKGGKDADVEWNWIQSTNYEEKYNDENWTKLGFNDTEWSKSLAPFGDSSIDGINYKTTWDGDNYAYFRYIFNIDDISIYEGGVMNINVASNNFGDHYINGIFVFGDLDQGSGHGAEYWNDEVQVYTGYLSQGENIVASIIGNPQNTQWFDQEISVTFSQANLWGYRDTTYNIPILLDTTAPATKVNEDGFYKNSTIISLTWKEISSDGDLEGFYLYYQVKDGSSIGDWLLYDYYTDSYSTNFSAENGMIYRFRTIGVDIYGNKEIKGVYDTEVKIDMDLPKSELWLSEGNIQFTNVDGVTINWKENETYDIQGYLIEFKEINDLAWSNYGLFTGIGEYWFEPDSDGTYLVRSRSIDYAGNREIKEIPDINITFDRIRPVVKLNQIDTLKNTDDLILSINYKSENLSTLNIEYARLIEGDEDILEWKTFDENWNSDEYTIRNLVDGYTYYFRINPSDFAGNDYSRSNFEFTFMYDNNSQEIILPTVPLKPVMTGKIKNVEITVDENLNGVYDKVLQEYIGNDLSGMKANQYWINYELGMIVFGNGDVGYLPPQNSSVSVSYSGYDLITTIDNSPPMPVQSVGYLVNEDNNLTIEWKESEDAVSYIIENRSNFSKPWETVENINYTKNKMIYEISNLSGGFHYYRIISVDRMGYQNANMDGEMLEIFIEYENVNNAANAKSDSSIVNNYIIFAGLLILSAVTIAAYIFKNKGEEVAIAVENSSILVPVEELAEKEIKSIDEAKPAFSIVQGSQFSRTVLFVCEAGCQKEFENIDDDGDEEIMCPHCGSIGDSPL